MLPVSGSMQPGTSSMIQGLAACFTGLEDPRETSRCDHQLLDTLVIAVCAVIACAESWEDIALYGRSKQAWLETFLALPNGIPSHDTFPGVHADRPRRIRGVLYPLGAVLGPWGRARGGGRGWQNRPALRQPPPRSWAAARGQCLGKRTDTGACASRRRRKVE